jgi:enediyne biosynthesis protein E4
MYVADRPVRANMEDLAGQFAFSRHSLPEVSGPTPRHIRNMHPRLRDLASYLSSFGGGVAFGDLDQDGLPNDVCYVDARTDQVIVAPVPGTGNRYRPFALSFEAGGRKLSDPETMAPAGCLPADLDEDGRMDLIVFMWGRTPLAFLWRPVEGSDQPLGQQNFVPVEIIPGGAVWNTTSITLADLDGDGHLEMVVTNYFADGEEPLNPKATTPVNMPDSFGQAFNGGGVRIFRCLPQESVSGGTVGCAEVPDALPADLPRGWGVAVGAYDLDGDLLPEIYVANDYGADRLLWNRSTPGRMRFELVEGERSLTKPLSLVIGRDGYHSMGVDFADLNGDGIPDIFVSNITVPRAPIEAQVLFLSTASSFAAKVAKGIAPYVEGAEALGLARSGWAWDVRIDDFNNDGVLEVLQAVGFVKGSVDRWPELAEVALGNDALVKYPSLWHRFMPGDDISGHERNPFYTRVGKRYVDIAAQIGFGEEDPSRGIAVADVDGDGKLDIAVGNMWGPSTYYHNECQRCGNFLGLHLRLPVAGTMAAATTERSGHPDKGLWGRPAIGAAVTVRTPGGFSMTRQVDGGNGHVGKRSPDLHFGLGAETGAVQVEIKWRDATGAPRKETLQLSPGWHTVLLASGSRTVPVQ